MENKQRIVLPSLGNIRMDRTRSQLRRFIGVMVCIAANKFAGAYQRAGHLKKLTNITANSNTRYNKSFRHFVGKQEQTERVADKNNVINKVVTQDFTFTRLFDDRWALASDIPYADNSRSQLNNRPGTRFSTHTFGIGDIRLTGYYWLFNPAKKHKFNVQIGLGAKFATGAYNLQDYFLQKDVTTKL